MQEVVTGSGLCSVMCNRNQGPCYNCPAAAIVLEKNSGDLHLTLSLKRLMPDVIFLKSRGEKENERKRLVLTNLTCHRKILLLPSAAHRQISGVLVLGHSED